MYSQNRLPNRQPAFSGVCDASPIVGAYIPIAVSFGLVSVQSGFSIFETVMVSILVYAGPSQFLFVAMVVSGAPLWLVVAMTILINMRYVVYGPNLAPHLPSSRWWPLLMHGLTDQIFALAHTRLPQLQSSERIGWFTGAMLFAWLGWISGTVLGAVAGEEMIRSWPLMVEVMPFTLPALFLVLLAPRFDSRIWGIALSSTIVLAFAMKTLGFAHAAIPVAAICGAFLFQMIRITPKFEQ
ncbi:MULTISPECIES: AzlC family ABC transporter permease [unclassified Marinobacter]|uniref:AzlC family ABC transporter permease n=1 Tax=unclassified Marinobacter TaxID=83889 RepID=UPI0026E1AE85|nr:MULTISPECIES: AzlC family ABC transporter permease [unclassified Marinobacter]MDO6443435.1 AzlC family ABC transporter permease [Marinobacter sp. 2_MG-2023]MDO6824173.1 AzlC family ABC transporter permease [Marinobacter sp. 1_MG-2023]